MDRTNERSPLLITSQPRSRSLLKVFLVVVVACVVVAAVTTTLVLVFRTPDDPDAYSPVQTYSKAAIVSDAKQCSAIGKDVLLKGGSSVDSAIATSLCVGIYSMQSSGIGGGAFMMIYESPRDSDIKELTAIDFREVAPSAANISIYNQTEDMYSKGGFSVGLPSEIAGYWAVWQRYGRLPWSTLFEPTIKLCKDGFIISKFLENEMKSYEDAHMPETCKSGRNIRDIIFKPDGSLYKAGNIMKLPKLAATLEKIAKSSDASEFYTGSLSVDVLKDLQDISSLITASDLSQVKPVWRNPINFTVGEVQLSTLPLPSGGPVLNLILNILKEYPMPKDKVLAYHRIVEADKFAYALKTKMGDPQFADLAEIMKEASSLEFAAEIRARLDDSHTHNVSYYDPLGTVIESHGTSHIGILSPDGAAVAMTSTINGIFGSKCVGKRTGIIFNNELDDFLIPSDATSYRSVNLVEGGKRAQSSMCPTIMFDQDNRVVGVTGGSGGSQITTAVAYVLWQHLIAGEGIDDAVRTPRLHHKLTPNVLHFEPEFPKDILRGLQHKGHKLEEDSDIGVCNSIQSTCHQAGHQKNCILAVSDRRKMGEPDGF